MIRRLVPDWKQHLILVQPETVVRWHRQGWRLYWRWRSGRHLGRPRLSLEIRELIATMASANRLWGTERIRGELHRNGVIDSFNSRLELQRTALFTREVIFASSMAVNFMSAYSLGHMPPSSRFALSLKPRL